VWSITLLHIQLYVSLRLALEPLVWFQWHELQKDKPPFTLFSISACVLVAMSGKLIDYRKKSNKLWVKSMISDGNKSNRERIHSLPESTRLPGLIIQHNLTFSSSCAVIFQQNKRMTGWIPPASSYQKYCGWKLLLCQSHMLVLLKVLFWKSSSRKQNQINFKNNLEIWGFLKDILIYFLKYINYKTNLEILRVF